MALFELNKVTYEVLNPQGQRLQLLKEIDLAVDEGELFTIIGPSGAGKSSLIYLLNRLHEVTAGQINYAGQPIKEYEVTKLRREVALLLQKPFMLPGTVLANILAGPQLSGSMPRRTPEELLTLVGLAPALLSQAAKSLSGGEQQRVSLARLLANSPRVLLLDEPTAALNQAAADEVEHLISHLIAHEKLTVIMVTHDLDQARRLGTTTALLVDGRVVECQATKSLFSGAQQNLTVSYLEENWQRGGVK